MVLAQNTIKLFWVCDSKLISGDTLRTYKTDLGLLIIQTQAQARVPLTIAHHL